MRITGTREGAGLAARPSGCWGVGLLAAAAAGADEAVVVVVESGGPAENLLALGLGQAAPTGAVVGRQEAVGGGQGGRNGAGAGPVGDIQLGRQFLRIQLVDAVGRVAAHVQQ